MLKNQAASNVTIFVNQNTCFSKINFFSPLAMKHEKVTLISCGRNHTIIATGIFKLFKFILICIVDFKFENFRFRKRKHLHVWL